jgi:hypothetical protein
MSETCEFQDWDRHKGGSCPLVLKYRILKSTCCSTWAPILPMSEDEREKLA